MMRLMVGASLIRPGYVAPLKFPVPVLPCPAFPPGDARLAHARRRMRAVDPAPSEIEALAAQIREGWDSDTELDRRVTGPTPAAYLPVVSVAAVIAALR